MYLHELIAELERHDPTTVVRTGFDSPHSYRGYYDELAFEPASNVTIGSMLEAAREANGSTYRGWKGGGFTMEDWTPCHLAYAGSTGDPLSARLLAYMLADVAKGE